MRARLAIGLGLLALAGCRGLTLAEVDGLHESIAVRTVLHGDAFTLWSPLDAEASVAWFELVEREAPAVEGVFGPDALAPQRLQVLLERVEPQSLPLPAPGETVTVRIYPSGSRHGVVGHASGDVVTLYLAPPRRVRLDSGVVVQQETDPERLVSVLRHELAHVAAQRAGLDLPTWLSEGAADVVEALELEGGRLVDVGPTPLVLAQASGLDRDEWGVAPLLDWSERGERVARGEERVDLPRRQLCGLYVRWLLGLEADGRPVEGLAARLAELERTPREKLLAGEPAWRAWLEAQVAVPTP